MLPLTVAPQMVALLTVVPLMAAALVGPVLPLAWGHHAVWIYVDHLMTVVIQADCLQHGAKCRLRQCKPFLGQRSYWHCRYEFVADRSLGQSPCCPPPAISTGYPIIF
jgi:hypothetical protein